MRRERDAVRNLLIQIGTQFTERNAQNGVQFRCEGGESITHFTTGTVSVQGPHTDLRRALTAWFEGDGSPLVQYLLDGQEQEHRALQNSRDQHRATARKLRTKNKSLAKQLTEERESHRQTTERLAELQRQQADHRCSLTKEEYRMADRLIKGHAEREAATERERKLRARIADMKRTIRSLMPTGRCSSHDRGHIPDWDSTRRSLFHFHEWKCLHPDCDFEDPDHVHRPGASDNWLEADHVQSIHDGGMERCLRNLQTLCKRCNRRKYTTSIDYRTDTQRDWAADRCDCDSPLHAKIYRLVDLPEPLEFHRL